MTQDITPAEFAAAIGPAPSPKQNLVELETGALLASDIPNVNIAETVTAVNVASNSTSGLAAPHLYVPALSQPSHPMRAQDRSGQWFELAQSVDLRHFGPVVDNRGADIGPALRNFLEYAKEKGGGSVYIPPGIFSLESPVTENLNLPSGNMALGIFGYGTEVSRLVVDGSSIDAGPAFTSSNRGAFYHFEGFAILADGTVNGRPLSATLPLNGGSRRNCSHIVRDILVEGYGTHVHNGAPYNDHFTHGLNFTGAWRMIFENNHISGPIPPVGVKALNDWSDSSILWRMQDGLVIDGAYAPVVRDTQFYFIAQPVLCRGHPDGPQPVGTIEAERALFQNVRCPTCKVGIEWFRTGSEPELVITDCFFDFRDRGLEIKGSRLGQIYRNAFFQKTATGSSPIVPADIRLEHCVDFLVDHNLHHESGDTRRIGISLVDSNTTPGFETTGIEMRHNRVSTLAVMDAYLFKGANTGSAVLEPGIINGSINRLVNDASAATKVRLDLKTPYSLSASVGAVPQSLTDNAWQSVSWDNVSYNAENVSAAWDGGSAEAITVPMEQGISQVQLRVTLAFDDSGSGVRQVELLKNGAVIDAGLSLSSAAAVGAPTILSGTTDWIEAGEGDVFAVRARQTSGASLDLVAPTSITASFR